MHASLSLTPCIFCWPLFQMGDIFYNMQTHLCYFPYNYIIVDIDYFSKWDEAISTYSNTTTLFVFNHIISRFTIPKSIVIDHGSHFCNAMMTKLDTLPHFNQEHSSPYYPQANGQVESVNCVLKTMIQRMAGKHNPN